MAAALPPIAVFTERQNMGRYWWWLVLLLDVFITALTLFLPTHISWHHRLLTAGLACIVSSSLLLLRLETLVDADGIHYRYTPLLNRWRHRSWSEFKQVYVREYSPMGEYGGWGIKGLPGDLAYNVAGKYGLQLVFQNGDRLLLGTQRPDELRQIIMGREKSSADHSPSIPT